MKDLIHLILKNLASYLPVLFSVVSAPKQAIINIIDNEPDKLNQALIFVGVTLAIGFAFQIPFTDSGQSFYSIVGFLLAFKIVVSLSFPIVILFIFKLFKGQGNYLDTLCAYLYIASPLYLFVTVLEVIIYSIIFSHDPELASTWRNAAITKQQFDDFYNTSPFLGLSYGILYIVYALCQYIWLAICWGIFRHIHKVNKASSVLAFFITAVAWSVFGRICYMVGGALYGGAFPPIR